MREIEKHYMRYVAFTVFPRYFCYVPQSVLFGRFVEQMREALFLAFHHAEGLKNTASEVCRASSHPLRWHGAVAAFLQQAPVALAASAFSQDASATRQLPSLRSDWGSPVRHHGGPATHQQDRDSAVVPSCPGWASRGSPTSLPCADSSNESVPTRSVSLSACTINCALNSFLCPDGGLPSPSIWILWS